MLVRIHIDADVRTIEINHPLTRGDTIVYWTSSKHARFFKVKDIIHTMPHQGGIYTSVICSETSEYATPMTPGELRGL